MQVEPQVALPKILLARYYGANLARFLSVDPVGGSAGTPQSWNRYAYTRNNPLKFVDPDGRRIEIAGKGQKQVRGMLVETARRPGGRAALQTLADSDKTYTFTKASLNDKNAGLIWDLRQKSGTSADLTFGTTTPTEGGATIKLDTSVITEFHPDDKTGVATVVHESTHAQGVDEGLSGPEIEARDHSPDIYNGEASKEGRAVAGEEPDKTKEQAGEVVDGMLEKKDTPKE